MDAYDCSTGFPKLPGVPFNDAYRYTDWLLTASLLLIDFLLAMKLSEEAVTRKAWTRGLGSALMTVSAYYGELAVTADLTPCSLCGFVSTALFLYIVYELRVGLAAATLRSLTRSSGARSRLPQS